MSIANALVTESLIKIYKMSSYYMLLIGDNFLGYFIFTLITPFLKCSKNILSYVSLILWRLLVLYENVVGFSTYGWNFTNTHNLTYNTAEIHSHFALQPYYTAHTNHMLYTLALLPKEFTNDLHNPDTLSKL